MADTPRAKRLLVTDLLDRGLVRYALGAREPAIELWRKALAQAPRNPRALDYLESVGALPAGSAEQASSGDDTEPEDRDPMILEPRSQPSLAPPFTQEVAAYDGEAMDSDDLDVEPIAGQRPLAVVIGAGILGTTLTALLVVVGGPTGAPTANAPLGDAGDNAKRLGEVLFTDLVFAVELTALLLTVAVVGAVVLVRRLRGPLQPLPAEAVASKPESPESTGPDGEAGEAGQGGDA